jgi:hypothetical protein
VTGGLLWPRLAESYLHSPNPDQFDSAPGHKDLIELLSQTPSIAVNHRRSLLRVICSNRTYVIAITISSLMAAMILLLPTVRPPTAQLPLRPTHNRARSKIGRISSASVDIVPPPQPRPWSPTDIAQQWIGLPLRFDILHDRLELEGYQIYAVEKW